MKAMQTFFVILSIQLTVLTAGAADLATDINNSPAVKEFINQFNTASRLSGINSICTAEPATNITAIANSEKITATIKINCNGIPSAKMTLGGGLIANHPDGSRTVLFESIQSSRY